VRLIAYIRVSTDDQREHGHSLGQQLARARAYCDLHEHELADVIADEGVSASVALAKRPGGAELLRKLADGTGDGVLVIRLDRLFRDALDGLVFFRDVCDRHGATVHSIAELIDTATPAGRLMLKIQLSTAEYERDLAVVRARETNRALREQGHVFGGVPFGCTPRTTPPGPHASQRKPRRLLERDPAMWETRCYIVSLLREGMSLRALQDRLMRERIPAPAGGKRWPLATLRNLLSTHETLTHLPLAPDSSVAASAEQETEVSHVALH